MKKGAASAVTEAIIKNKEQIAGWMLPFSLDDEALMAKVRTLVGSEDWERFLFLLRFMDQTSRDRVRHMVYTMDNPQGQKVKVLAKDEKGNQIFDKDGEPLYVEVTQEFSEHDLRVRYIRSVANDVRKAIESADEAFAEADLPESEKTPELREAFIAREIGILLDAMKLTGEFRDDLPIQRAKHLKQRVVQVSKDPEVRARAAMVANGAYLLAKEVVTKENARRETEIKSTTGPLSGLWKVLRRIFT
jgi:hypothetical protein